MTEIHAALGIANLKYFDKVLNDRKKKYEYYKNKLSENKKLIFQKLSFADQTIHISCGLKMRAN